jgi:hypothetical protein
LLVGAHREGGSELARIGPRPPTPPRPTRSRRWWILLAAFGVVVLGALAILARASFDTDDPTLRAQQGARRSAGNESEDRAAESAVATTASEPARRAPAAEPAPAVSHREALAGAMGSAVVPQSPPSPPAPASAATSTPAPASNSNSQSNSGSSARTHASRSSSSSSKEAHPGATSSGAASPSGNAAKAAGKNNVDGAGGAPGTKKPDPKLALAADLAKKDGAWQRPPFGEDANSRLVTHFTQAGGAVLKGRVIDADTGKPSAGVTVETHVGDVFMRAVTDAAGNFRMTNIFTNRRLTVWLIARSDSFVAERLELTSPGDGDTLDAGVVRLLRGDELASHLEGWMGMFVTRRGRRNVVAAVSPWSPADRAGIQVGDVLLSIEGRDVGGLGPRAASFLLRGPVGSKSTVALQNRDGTVVRYQLERVLR